MSGRWFESSSALLRLAGASDAGLAYFPRCPFLFIRSGFAARFILCLDSAGLQVWFCLSCGAG
jgi:hypothetical protein